MGDLPITEESKEALKEARLSAIIKLSLLNAPLEQIASETGLSKYHVKKIMNTEEFRTELKERSDEALSTAKATLKAAMTERIPEYLKVLDHHLREKNLAALPLMTKLMGMDQVEQQSGPTTIQITLPGESKPIDIESEVVDEIPKE